MNTKKDGKIILIEQDEQVREITKRFLEDEGYTNIHGFMNIKGFILHCADTGSTQRDVALIICNMGFQPETQRTSGMDYLCLLRQSGHKTPFVFLTGGPVTVGQADMISTLGNAAVVGKPFTQETLASIVDSKMPPGPFVRQYDDPALGF